jgi:hypothetical protein
MSYIETQYRLYVVGERPFCFWASDVSQQTLRFLESLDPSYFESIANVFIPNINESQTNEGLSLFRRLQRRLKLLQFNKINQNECDSQHAALALRLTYSQSLETLFALIGATVQAPRCAHAWMAKYKPSELRKILQDIQNHRSFPWQLKETTPSWNAVSDCIFNSLVLDDEEKEANIKKAYSQFWAHLASDFVKQDFTDEYNSIKHGLRVKLGGFSFAIGKEDEPGVPAPKDKMQLLGRSDYGSSFSIFEKIGENNLHHQSKNLSRNWSPIDIAWALHLVSMSISNVISALKILNGIPADQVKFMWPDNLNILSEPWKRTKKLGITTMGMIGHPIHPVRIKPFTKEEILTNYSIGKDGGVIRIDY